MYCNHCGSPVPEGSQFCNVCGRAIPAQGPPPTGPFPRAWPITAVAILDILGGTACLASGAIVFLGSSGKDGLAAGFGLTLAVIGTWTLMTGVGLLRLKPLARTSQLILSVIGLAGFPFGTLISILVLVYLAKPGMKVIFSGRPREEMTPAELALAAPLAATSGASAAVAIVASVLVIVFMVGIIAAIAIPNLITAIDRGKQKRTMADMRTIAAAMEAYATDHGAYPQARSVHDLQDVLAPTYVRVLPAQDAWLQDFRVRVWRGDERSTGPDSYAIVSAGKGGVFQFDDLSKYRSGPTTDFTADIVFANGSFFRFPAETPP
jgi:type II secretory pathway pseudopilin PulG